MAHDPDCLFCGIVSRQIPATIVDEDERTLVFMDINPAAPGHLLVIPKEHSVDLLEIGAEDLAAAAQMAQRQAGRLMEVLGADGVNVLNCCRPEAWQSVFHFHLHVIPRSAGDPLRLPWVPSPGDAEEIRAVGARLGAPS